MAPALAAHPKRNLQLDVLRGIAILMVLACHSIFIRRPWFDAPLVKAGWSGVDLFFVVSGFLISGLLFGEYRRSGRIRFRRFAIRRAIKIYPALWVLVAVTIAVRWFAGTADPKHAIFLPLVHDIFFVQSYFEGTWGHFWSLSVEEHFYILLPVTLYLMVRRAQARGTADPFRALPMMFAVVAVALLAARLWTASHVHPFSYQTHLFPTHLRLDSLFFGVILSYWYHFHRERFTRVGIRYRGWLLAAAAVLLAPLFFIGQYDRWMYTYGFTCLYLGYGCLLVGLLHVPLDRVRGPVGAGIGAVAYIGTFSYSIYLWHIAWLVTMQHIPVAGVRFAYPVLFYGGSVLIGIVAGKIVEFPALRLRDRLFPSSAPAPVVST